MTPHFNIHTRDDGLYIVRLEPPRFSARIHIGELPPGFKGTKWTSYGSGGDDIHFEGLTFYDPVPTSAEKVYLMDEAALYTEEQCVTPGF